MSDTFEVRLSERAFNDLASIFSYIRASSPGNAPGVIDHILEKIRGLDTLPAGHPIVGKSRRSRAPVHKLVIAPYLVYYSVETAQRMVWIKTVRHGARRQPKRFD